MALAMIRSIDKIEVLDQGQIQVREGRLITDGPEVVARAYHRHCLVPGQDISAEDPRVIAIAGAVWTPGVIAAFKAQQATLV